MASDRARISFDPTRDYRSVVAQQGRVTLEADVNEAAQIQSEALRLETIDLVGPAGTPDDGYKVDPSSGLGALTIGAGTFYLGGWRLTLDQPVKIAQQPDWLDQPALNTAAADVVSLLITEQSVCAVEDQALREVALGGPDSAARLRLLQHFVLTPTQANNCAAAAGDVGAALATDGVTLDPKTDQLVSSATLQVSFVQTGGQADPCSPVAQGGYLGADNQLVRVTVVSFDPKARTGLLMWGWNNASFLYRATLTDPKASVLTLSSVPVDQEHAPQLGQAVEILRSRVDLGDGDFIAADAGFVTVVSQAYSFDTGTLTLADPLPVEYQGDPNPLFVRLWQSIVPFNVGQSVSLDSTSGLAVTIGMTALPSLIAARLFWRFAVRPNTPVQVYPARYQEGPQPPDGPRQWLCDLAVVAAQGAGGQLVEDCRPKFPAQATACCGLVLDPSGVEAGGGLQAVVDSLAGGPAMLSLKPGVYTLASPLMLTRKHAGLTIEGCSGGVTLQADPNALAPFAFGLIVISETVDVTLRGLRFVLPVVSAQAGTATSSTMLGVLAAQVHALMFDGCEFVYQAPGGAVTAAGVAALGVVAGLTVRDCRFAAVKFVQGAALFGIFTSSAANTRTAVDDLEITGSLFRNLAVGALAFAELGFVRCADNLVRDCATGFYFAASNLGASSNLVREALATQQRAGSQANLVQALRSGFDAPLMARSSQFAEQLFGSVGIQPQAPPAAAARNVLSEEMKTRGTTVWRELSAGGGSTDAATTTGPTTRRAARPGAAAARANAEFTNALDRLNEIAIGAELAAVALTPVLHIDDNDVSLLSSGATPGLGIGVVFSPKDEVGTVMMSGNRALTPDARTAAAAVLFASLATVNGNALLQSAGAFRGAPAPAFILVGMRGSLYAVAGNLVRSSDLILPARATAAPTDSWEFLNTVG